MVDLSRARALLVIGVLLLIAGLCTADQARVTLDHEAAEACCAFTQCSVLPIALFIFALLAAGAYLRPTTLLLVRSAVQDPLSPPPELIAFRSA